MANTFITPSMVARDAAITISNRLIVGNHVSRDKEAIFTGNKVGDSVKVTVPPTVSDASEFTGTTTASDVTEKEIDLTLEKHYYKRADLTTKQKSLELSDFTRLITVPFMDGIADSVDKYILSQMQVFRQNLTGNVANRPSTMAHIAAATKKLNDLKLAKRGRVSLVDSTVEESLSQLTQFQNTDFGQEAAQMLREGVLGRRYGFDFITDTNLGAFERGDVAGTVLINGTVAIGGTTVAVDAFTEATGTVRAGTVFTIAGDTTRYTVRKDATIASNAATLTITPALVAEATNNAEITVEAAGFSNLVYHPNAISAAIIAPQPLNGNSAVESYNGISVRVSMDSSITSLSDSIVYDVFCGARVVEPNGGALFCG